MSYAENMVRDRDGTYFTGKHRGFPEILVFVTQVPSLKNENGGLECSFCRNSEIQSHCSTIRSYTPFIYVFDKMGCFVSLIQDKNISVNQLTCGVQFNQWKLNSGILSLPNSNIIIVTNECCM